VRQYITMILVAGIITACFYVVGSRSEEQILTKVSYSSVQVNDSCTGTVVAPGTVLTAYHCVRSRGEDSDFTIRSGSNWAHMKFIAGAREDDRDMALLRGDLIATPAKIAARRPIPLKEHFVIGHPWGAISQVVSFLLYSGMEPTPIGTFDLYSGAVAPGNSGSGIFNKRGELVGVVLRAPRENSTFCLSVTYEKMLDFLRENGI